MLFVVDTWYICYFKKNVKYVVLKAELFQVQCDFLSCDW